MRTSFFTIVLFLAVLWAATIVLNFTLYNPAVVVPLYGWLSDRHVIQKYNALRDDIFGNGEAGYPSVSIGTIESNRFPGPRATVTGVITSVVQNLSDKDWHINIRDKTGATLVLEAVPEYPLTIPPIGTNVKVWGIPRYDIEHRWWELHPIFGITQTP